MQDSLGFWIPRCGFLIPGIKFRIPCQWNLDSGFQSLAGFRTSWAELRIPKSWISNSTRTNSTVEFGFHKQNFPDSGNRITLHGVMCTLNALSLLGEFSCKYHALKGFDHKIWLKLGFRISIISGIPDFLSWIADSQVLDFQFYKNKFYGWIWIPQAKFPRLRKSDYLTWSDVYLKCLVFTRRIFMQVSRTERFRP